MPAWSQQPARDTKEPHFDARKQHAEYMGPAERDVSVEQVSEIRIGYFAPSDPDDPVFGPMWQAAQAAIDDANRSNGFQGKPFRLLPAWSKDPWGTGVKQLTQLVYQQHVWAIIGGADGPSTHLAEQVVAKARLALVSPISTDKTVNLANVPWMFSLAPADHLVAQAMAPHISSTVESKSWVLISANDHDSFLLTRELRKALSQLHVTPAYQFEFKPGSGQLNEIIEKSLAAQPEAVVAIGDADESLRIVRTLRRDGFDGRIFGGPSLGQHRFLSQIGAPAGNLRFPLLTSSLPQPGNTVKHTLPADADFTALHTYDAVQMTITAIRRAGLNRKEIGRQLRGLSPYHGVSGTVEWDGLGSNTRAVTIGTIQNARAVPLPVIASE